MVVVGTFFVIVLFIVCYSAQEILNEKTELFIKEGRDLQSGFNPTDCNPVDRNPVDRNPVDRNPMIVNTRLQKSLDYRNKNFDDRISSLLQRTYRSYKQESGASSDLRAFKP